MDMTVTTLDPSNAIANVAAASQVLANYENSRRYSSYKTSVANWNLNADAGRIPTGMTQPVQPTAVKLAPANEGGFQIGWVEDTGNLLGPALTVDPVKLQIDVLPPANHIHVGHGIGSGWYDAASDDTCKSGFVTPPVIADGETVPAIFTKYGAPVGNGWYLKS